LNKKGVRENSTSTFQIKCKNFKAGDVDVNITPSKGGKLGMKIFKTVLFGP
jgi:hypothetical protein